MALRHPQAQRSGLLSTRPSTKVSLHTYRRKPLGRSVVMASSVGVPLNSWQDAGQRALAAGAYFLPFADSLRYGRYLSSSYPVFEQIFHPLQPLVNDFQSTSYGSLLAFAGIFLGIVLNNKLSRFARFNGMQALVLEVITVTPALLYSLFGMTFSGGVYENSCSLLWLFVASCVVLGVVSSLRGTWLRLPFVTDMAGKYFP